MLKSAGLVFCTVRGSVPMLKSAGLVFLHSARMIYEKRAIFAIFRDFLRRKTVGQLHYGRLRYRAWYRWKACRKSFPTVLRSIEKVGVVQKIQ